jgi:hypothetical protein
LNAFVMDASDHAHAFSLAIELRLAQKTPDKPCGIIGLGVQPNQTVRWVDQRAAEETLVQRKERGAPMTVKEWDDVRVLNSEPRQLSPDLPEWYMPLLQEGPLVLREVFVQQVQAAASEAALLDGVRAELPVCGNQAARASLSASATAARAMRPPQRLLQINSHDLPSATSSSTCQTIMRVPLKVGCPWQISGSATIYRPNSTRCFERRESCGFPFFMALKVRFALTDIKLLVSADL